MMRKLSVGLGVFLGSAYPAHAFQLPDPRLTPGVADARVTAAMVCRPDYASRARNVTHAMKRRVCRAYKKSSPCPKGFEIDHRIPLSLGGDNSIYNLWPQPWREARVKDKLEWALYYKVCHNTLSLVDAQKIILNWPKH